MHQFTSGYKKSYYGKADVTVYRLKKPSKVFGANVTMLVYGDAFWPTYTTGDNTGLVATDSMKNFIQMETANFDGFGMRGYCRFLADRFLQTYRQCEGVQVQAEQIPYHSHNTALKPDGPERATGRVEVTRARVVEARAGIRGFRLLRLGGSAFTGFVRDQYTTLPETTDRPLHMWLDLEWDCVEEVTAAVRELVYEVFESFESGSIQQVIYQIGTRMLERFVNMTAVDLEANNRTWDRVAEEIYTDPRPPYGVLGLRLRR